MEIDKKQIARLVLGYLKSENCKSAFNEFLMKSKYLKSYAVFVKNGKYFATRVGGLTLEEILAEYSDIALIIQGRLEQTDYYDKGLKLRLSEQLTYILENESRSSSPSLSKDLDATPVESLPGNSSNDYSKSPNSTIDKSNRSSMHITSVDHETCQNLSQKEESSLDDLDNQLRTLNQKAEKDPVFDKLLEGFIGKLKNILRKYDQGHKNDISRECTTTDKNNTVKILGSVQGTETGQNCSAPLSLEIARYPSITTQPQQIPQMKNITALSDSSVLKPMPEPSNQIFFANTGGLLMVPSGGGCSKYILVNNPPPKPMPLNNIMTEADLMKMPTLILEDSTQQSNLTVPQPHMVIKPAAVTQSQIIITTQPQVISTTQKSTVSTCTAQNINKQLKALKPLAPKTDKITIATSDGDYYEVLDDKDAQCTSSLEDNKDRPGVKTRSSRLPTKVETSPRKEASSPTSEKKKKSAKNLFKENKKGKTSSGDTWDAELRELLIPKRPVEEEPMDTSNTNLEISINDEELQREAMIIEAAFKTPVKTDCASKKQHVKKEPTGDKEASESEEKSDNSGKSVTTKSEESEDVIFTEQTEVHLRNCNGPPKIKKKCNVTDRPETFEIVEILEEDETPIPDVKNEKQEEKLSLETPVKEGFPKTPGKFEMTPFTKAIEEQLLGMDLLSLPTPSVETPSFPITPSVRFTPEHHSNRPTDYSTSSSYYQPSDNEQNKSLEAVMDQLRGPKNQNSSTENVAEIKSMFNKNVIGTKNLNLIKKRDSSDSDSCSAWSGEGSSDSDSDCEKTVRRTKSSYSFRKRTSAASKNDDAKKTTPKSDKKGTTAKKSSGKGTKKKIESKVSNDVEKCDNENEITDDDFALHLSTDEDSTNKVSNEVVAAGNKEAESPKAQTPTESSNQLIQDLYDRGIHLLPKVQPKSDSSSAANNPNALENLVVSEDEEDVNATVNPADVTFDCVDSEENNIIHFVYDSSKRRKKKVYDLSNLERKIEATVYVESLDIDVTRFMTFTPTVTILDCSPIKPPAKKRRPDNKPKPKKDDKPIIKPVQVEAKLEKDTSSKTEESRRKSISRRSSRCFSERTKSETGQKIGDNDGGKGDLIGLTVESDKPERIDEERLRKDKDDDDLMDFAVLGEKAGAKDDVKGGEKRKLSSEAESVPPEKRTKTETEKQALLKNVNVDLFLNEVHGGGERPK